MTFLFTSALKNVKIQIWKLFPAFFGLIFLIDDIVKNNSNLDQLSNMIERNYTLDNRKQNTFFFFK